MQFRTLRIDVSARVIGVWALAFALPGLMFGSLIIVITTFSVPFLIAAAVLSLWFGDAILRRPIPWSLAAIAVPLFGGCAIFGRAGLLSLVIAVPAACYFVASLRIIPPTQRDQIDVASSR
jgi:hypothetical protein